MHRLRRLLELTAPGDIPVDLQNSGGISLFIAHQRPAAFHDHDAAIPAGMHEFPFPLTLALDPRLDDGEVEGKTRLEQDMADAALRLLCCPAVEFLGALIPEEHPATRSRGLRLISTGNSSPSLRRPTSCSPTPIGRESGAEK